MKRRNVIVVGLLLLVSSFSMDVMAQESVKALLKKCESMEGVNVNTIRRRNKETRKISQVITSIVVDKENTSLINEFITAFEKDREYADQEIENKSNGKVTNLFYRFGGTSCSYDLGEDGDLSISFIAKEEN